MIIEANDRFDIACKAVGLNTDVPIYYRREFIEAIRLFAARTNDDFMENEAIQVIGALWKEDMAEQDADAELQQGIIDSCDPAEMEAGWEALQAGDTSDCPSFTKEHS